MVISYLQGLITEFNTLKISIIHREKNTYFLWALRELFGVVTLKTFTKWSKTQRLCFANRPKPLM